MGQGPKLEPHLVRDDDRNLTPQLAESRDLKLSRLKEFGPICQKCVEERSSHV
jgi:hypothetical protein